MIGTEGKTTDICRNSRARIEKAETLELLYGPKERSSPKPK